MLSFQACDTSACIPISEDLSHIIINDSNEYTGDARFAIDTPPLDQSNNPMLPDFGTVGNNMGAGMVSNLMSNNGCDIESQLRGLGASDLEGTHRKINPSLNKMRYLAFFDRPVVCAPNPLVVEHNQRPTGPFTSN